MDGSAIGVGIALVVAIGLDAEVGVTKDGTESADWAVTANGDTTGCGEVVTGWQLAIRKSSTTTQTSKGRFILVPPLATCDLTIGRQPPAAHPNANGHD